MMHQVFLLQYLQHHLILVQGIGHNSLKLLLREPILILPLQF